MSGRLRRALTAWRAALRIARRDALRAKGRSALVMAMIALPVLGVGAADIVARSSSLTPDESATRQMGSAQALVAFDQQGYPTAQIPDGLAYAVVRGSDGKVHGTPEERARARVAPTDLLAQALPAGSRLVPLPSGAQDVPVTTAYGQSTPVLRELDLGDPAVRGLLTLRQGHWPDGPGQIAATTAFLKDAGLRPGQTTTLVGSRQAFTVTAAVEYAGALNDRVLIAPPGAFARALTGSGNNRLAAAADGLRADHWLVVTPGGAPVTWDQVLRANAYGAVVVSRAVLEHPPTRAQVPYYGLNPGQQGSGYDRTELVLLATVAGMALLEVVLLAGPAFAVGARRSRRQLGLIAAGGGDAGQIRAVVLGGGLVLGGAGALCGLVLAMAAVALGRGWLEQRAGARFGHYALAPVDLLGVVLLGVATGLLAAVVPAVQAARQPVMASLTGRGSVKPPSRKLAVAGLAALPLGAAAAWYGIRGHGSATAVLGGSVLVELGVVALAPTLVGLFGRLARLLPLAPRLALRDAARNRGRTAPAVAAVTAAVAGMVAVTMYGLSQDAQDRSQYTAQGPTGSVLLLYAWSESAQSKAAAQAAVAGALPDAGPRADLSSVVWSGCGSQSCGQVDLTMPADRRCPAAAAGGAAQQITVAQARHYLDTDARCRVQRAHGQSLGTVVAGDATALRVFLGVRDPAAERALAQGALLVSDPRYVRDGAATLQVTWYDQGTDADGNSSDTQHTKALTMPAVAVRAGQPGALALLSPAAAQAHGLSLVNGGAAWLPGRVPSSATEQKVSAALGRVDQLGSVRVERGFQPQSSATLLALVIAASVVAVAAAGIATGLAAADSQRDLATLAAVGAGPGIRRTLSGFQCAVIAAMGAVLGAAAGLVPATALGKLHQYTYLPYVDAFSGDISLPNHALVVPWATMAGAVAGLPLVAWALAALCTRSRIALARRAT